jgi:hypothetical protein
MVEKIVDLLRDTKYGLTNFWKWRKVIWNDRDWDWAYLYQAIEFKLLEMAKLHRKYGICVNAEEMAADMEKAARLLRRIYEDDYYPDEEWNYEKSRFMQQADLYNFAKLFRDKSMTWWD